MPTYQYVCTACSQDLEAVQGFSDAALTDCPACAGRLRKKFGSVGVVFKGSGFYRNDSRSGNGSGAAAASSDKPATEKSEQSAKSEKSDKPKESTSSTSGAKSSTSGGSTSSGSTSSTSTSSAA